MLLLLSYENKSNIIFSGVIYEFIIYVEKLPLMKLFLNFFFIVCKNIMIKIFLDVKYQLIGNCLLLLFIL